MNNFVDKTDKKCELSVTSEIFCEADKTLTNSAGIPSGINIVDNVTYFYFKRCGYEPWYTEKIPLEIDKDGDLTVGRNSRKREAIAIEHSICTSVRLVGLQVWRGGMYMADFITHYGKTLFANKTVFELGSGAGLTGIVATMYASHVIFSDLDMGGILDTIQRNVNNNRHLVQSSVQIIPFDFCNMNWSDEVRIIIEQTDIFIASDVIYDNDISEAFVKTIFKIKTEYPQKKMFVSLEKRHVFALENFYTSAVCYEQFKYCFHKENAKTSLQLCMIPIKESFHSYFEYNRTDDLELLEIMPKLYTPSNLFGFNLPLLDSNNALPLIT